MEQSVALLKSAEIVKDALDLFYKQNRRKTTNLTAFSGEIEGTTFKNNFRSIIVNGFFHPETLIGSANVRVKQCNSNTLTVTAFNISSF